MTKNRTLPLVECAIMIALATVLSMVKLAELLRRLDNDSVDASDSDNRLSQRNGLGTRFGICLCRHPATFGS